MRQLLKPVELLADLFYPKLCTCCGNWLVRGEEGICMHCLDELPKTNFELHKQNPVSGVFRGRVDLAFASSFLHFMEKGKTQKMLHEIKYKGKKELAEVLGSLFAADLKLQDPLFKPDMLIPVPLHPRKEKQRGYNQSLHIAMGLGQVLGAEVRTDILLRTNYSESQTRKARFTRWENVESIFRLSEKASINNKTIVLVDDVITTGATAESCLRCFSDCMGVQLGFLSLAVATG